MVLWPGDGEVIAEKWDIFKISFAVPDLERAMAEYERALGIEWGPIRIPEGTTRSDVYEEGISHEGVRAVLSANTGESIIPGVPAAAVELVHAAPGSPSFVMWGCPDGRQYHHHIAYWVDDFEKESQHLRDCGWIRELYLPNEGPPRIGYHRSPLGFRVSLVSASLKEAMARRLPVPGLKPFEWPEEKGQ